MRTLNAGLTALRHRRSNIVCPTILRAADNDRSSLLLRAAFDPVDITAVDQTPPRPIEEATIRSEVIGEAHDP